MTPRVAYNICSGAQPASPAQLKAAWQALHDTKLAYNLGGHFAETARSMIADGMIETKEDTKCVPHI